MKVPLAKKNVNTLCFRGATCIPGPLDEKSPLWKLRYAGVVVLVLMMIIRSGTPATLRLTSEKVMVKSPALVTWAIFVPVVPEEMSFVTTPLDVPPGVVSTNSLLNPPVDLKPFPDITVPSLTSISVSKCCIFLKNCPGMKFSMVPTCVCGPVNFLPSGRVVGKIGFLTLISS
jgi:hypothetical protein